MPLEFWGGYLTNMVIPAGMIFPVLLYLSLMAYTSARDITAAPGKGGTQGNGGSSLVCTWLRMYQPSPSTPTPRSVHSVV